jgi:hypothetical protein
MIYSECALKEKCEEGRIVGAGTRPWRSVTGEPYVKIGAQAIEYGIPSVLGTVDEGAGFEVGFDDESAFWTAWANFRFYAEERKGILYWYTEPELIWNEDRSRCYFYMRCLISDASSL